MKRCAMINSGRNITVLESIHCVIVCVPAVVTNSDCWPVLDKKQEQQFRKISSEWISRISKVCVLLEYLLLLLDKKFTCTYRRLQTLIFLDHQWEC